MALAETAELAIRINLEGNAAAGVKKLNGQLSGLQKSAGRVGKGVGQIGAGLGRAGLFVGGAAIAGLGAAAKAAIDFETAFAGVRKTVDASDEELQVLSDQFRKMATEIPIAATEFARLGEIGGALGIATDAIDEFARTTALLGETTDLTADTAAEALGKIGNIVGLTADDFDNFGSALVNLGNKGASTEPEIIEITKRFAAAGKQAGLTTPEILGLSEAVASFTGLAPEAAGSSLSRLTGILTKVAAGGGEKFKTLNKIVGKDFRKALDKDASGALIDFLKGLRKLDKYERANALKELGLDSVLLRQLLGGLTDNVDGLEASLANAEEGWRGNFLNEEAAKKFDTVAAKLTLLRNGLIESAIVIGEGFTPALGRAAEKLSGFLKQDANRSALKSIGEDIGKAIDGIDWDAALKFARDFVDVMKIALDFSLRIANALNSLPAELKGAAAALLVANKLSGGLVGAGVGNVVGGLAGAAAQGLASRAPGVGRLFAQPVFVTNWPIGMGLGGGAGAAGAAGGAGALGKVSKGLSVLGGIGITLAALVGVLDTQQAVSGASTAQAQGVRDTSTVFLAQNPTTEQLLSAMAGVDKGIEDLQGNPLHILVQGDALKTLQQTKADINTKLAATALEVQRKGEQTVQSVDQSKQQISARAAEISRETTRGATQVQATQRSTAAAIQATIRASRPIVNIDLSVSATTVEKNINVTNRYGPQGGSRAQGTGAGISHR